MKLKSLSKAIKKYHPDINKEADAEEKFKEVSEAYEILSDPQNGQLMINMDTQVPIQTMALVEPVAALVVLAAFQVAVLVASKISLIHSLAVAVVR